MKRKERREPTWKGGEGQINKFLSKPLFLSHFLPNLGTPKSLQMVGPERKHLGPTKINPPPPLSSTSQPNTQITPILSSSFSIPHKLPQPKIKKCEEEPKEKREGRKNKEQEIGRSQKRLCSRGRERERERTCGGEKKKRKKNKRRDWVDEKKREEKRKQEWKNLLDYKLSWDMGKNKKIGNNWPSE